MKTTFNPVATRYTCTALALELHTGHQFTEHPYCTVSSPLASGLQESLFFVIKRFVSRILKAGKEAVSVYHSN